MSEVAKEGLTRLYSSNSARNIGSFKMIWKNSGLGSMGFGLGSCGSFEERISRKDARAEINCA